MPHDGSLRLMSYNVHSCFGTDGVLSLSRIADVIETYRPDVVALQEVDVMRVRTAGENQAQRLAERLRMGFLFSAAHRVEDGRYGNALLSRLPMISVREAPLPSAWWVRAVEPRAAQWVRLAIGDRILNLVNTHLGLGLRERLAQTTALLGAD